MAIKSIFHFYDMNDVNGTLIDSVAPSLRPIVILSNHEGKHVQVEIQEFNAENTDKQSLSFAQRIAYYKKILGPVHIDMPPGITTVNADNVVF